MAKDEKHDKRYPSNASGGESGWSPVSILSLYAILPEKHKVEITPTVYFAALYADGIESALFEQRYETATEIACQEAKTIEKMKVNGKNWQAPRTPFRSITKTGKSAYSKRAALTSALAATKTKEKEMKDEKEAERQQRIQAIKDKRERKAERERWEALEQKMHRKRVERMKRKEKRNKLLNS